MPFDALGFGMKPSLRACAFALTMSVGLAYAGQQGIRPTQLSIDHDLSPILRQSSDLGAASGTEVLHLAINLQPRHLQELEMFCNEVSDPKSLLYGHWLTPQEVGESYGASATDVSNVVGYLRSQGFAVTLVAPNRMAVLADATVAQAQKAFGTQIHYFTGPAPEGRGTITYRANTTPLRLPSSLSSVVDVDGLETYTRPLPRATTTTLNPDQTRGLYNTAPAYSANFRGQGRTIGISNWDGFKLVNAQKYITQYKLPVPSGGATSNISVVSIDGGSMSRRASGEGDLDLQMVLGMAPLANIIVYDGASSLTNVLTREVSDNVADIISESYGWNISASTATAAHNLHLSMTAQGITYMAASGDSGTSLEPYSYPNYDPEVLMVGGTVATVNTTTFVRQSEVGWSGSGGGWSTNTASFNTLPSWQTGTGVPTGINKRLCPDVALHASGSNAGAYYFYLNKRLTGGYVGTSFACPVFAGCLGLAEQKIISRGGLPGQRFGRIQDLFYSQNGRSDVWFDITSGANGNLPNGTSSSAHAGWDYVTGWGAINFDAFVNSVAPAP